MPEMHLKMNPFCAANSFCNKMQLFTFELKVACSIAFLKIICLFFWMLINCKEIHFRLTFTNREISCKMNYNLKDNVGQVKCRLN